MKELKDWLDSIPGMATKLCKKLGVNATNISNWRNGHKPIPWTHMPTIASISRGKVPLKKMLEHRKASTVKAQRTVSG